MPGNEVGDRVHNFFDQGNLSQDQSHAQLGDGNWQLFNQNPWSGSERQTAGTLNSSSRNYSAQQADFERAQGNQLSLGAHGLNFIQSSSKPEFVKNSSQLNSNGYMHSTQIFPPRHNEANFLGVNSEPDQHNLTSRGLSTLESQQRSTLQHANSASFGGSEFPMNFNFLSSQQQMGGQPPGRLQSLSRPQSVINDTQLMQQHLMVKHMQEVQRQQQLQQLEAMQRNAASPMPTFPSQMDGHRSASNGNPLHNASSYQWHSPAGNVNWMQTGPASGLQGYSNGLMISPEQGQIMRFMNLIPQQASPSLFGVPVSNSRTANLFSHNIDKPAGAQVAPPGNVFSGNQYNPLPEQMSMQDGSNVSGSVSEGKGFFEHGVSQSLGNQVNAGSFNQMQPRNVPMSEGGRQISSGGCELAPGKSVTPPAASQPPVGLDPAEEKILFGNDDNIWDAFGGSSLSGTDINRLDGTDALNGFSFMQSGTWSALMQSAVAEASSSDAGPEELSGLDSQNSKLQSRNQPPSVRHDNKQMGSRVVTSDVGTANCFNTSVFPQQAESQISQGRKWLDCNKPNSHAESNHAPENAIPSQDFSKTDMGSWSHQHCTFLPQSSGQPSSRLNLNFLESVPENGAAVSSNQLNFQDNFSSRNMSTNTERLESAPNFNVKVGSPQVNAMDAAAASNMSNTVNHEHNQKLPDRNDLDLWKPANSYAKYEGSDKVLHNLNEGPAGLESSVSIPNHVSTKLHETGTDNQTENLNESHLLCIPQHALPGGLTGNIWPDAGESPSLPGGQEKLSCQSVKKPIIARKFQYHPMGDVDMDLESSVAQKHVQSQPMSQHFSSVVKGPGTQSRFFGSVSSNSMDMEQACVSGFQGPVKMPHGISSAGVHSGCSPSTSATFVRSGEISSTNQRVSSSQNMLQFLNMVEQSKEQNVVAPHNLSDSNRLSNATSHEHDGFNQNRSSSSHGFNLQLAPPSQGVASPNFHARFQNSSRPMDSPNLGQLTSDKGETTHAWMGSVSSAQCLPPSSLPPQMQSGSDRLVITGSMDANDSQQSLKGKLPAPVASASPVFRNSLHNQHMTTASGEMVNNKSACLFDRGAPHDHRISDSKDLATAVQSVNNAQQNLSSGSYMNQSGLRASMNQVPGPPAAIMTGMSRKDNLSQLGANMWISQSHLLAAQGHNVSQTSSSTQDKRDEQDGPSKFDASTSQGTFGRNEPPVPEAQSTGGTADASLEEEPTTENPPAASPLNSCASQKDVEAFHQSFKSNYVADNNYLSPNQMQAVKSTGPDSIHRGSKRLKGSDGGPDTQQAASESSHTASGGPNNVVTDSSVSQPLVSAGNSNILSYVPQSGNRNTTFQFPHGAVGAQDTLFVGNGPQKFIPGNVSRIEYSGICAQMAPSWIEQYGTLKNGQKLVPRIPVNKNAEEQSVSGTFNELGVHSSVLPVNPVDSAEIAISCQPFTAYTSREHVSSLEASAPHVSAPGLASIRYKKRKTATSDLIPWDKEVGQGIKRLPSMSLAEMNWARSSNRLVEKVEYETDNNDDASLITRPKRRLMLTTHLMQQVFRPPSAGVLSVDARSSSEIILYSLARLALVDACSQICRVEGDLPIHIESGNILTEKVKTSERIRDQYFSKVVEDFISRAKELEDDLVRLDKRASILDIRLDSQDLERFSVINRFARFHGRSQVDGAETSSSSDATAVAQKPCPQRYVSAIPMPKSVPERVQCLSL